MFLVFNEMGNCQAAEAATVVIQHPGKKIERIYWSVSAHEIMSSNPGHYVALVVTSPTVKTENGLPLKQLKLLRPDDTLLIGQVYRLISFEGSVTISEFTSHLLCILQIWNLYLTSFCADVLKEFASKNCVKLGKLLKDRRGLVDAAEMKKKESSGGLSLNPNPNPKPSSITKSETCSSVKVT